MNFKNKFDNWTSLVNEALDKCLIEKETPEKIIYQAMRYSLMAGGKRLRPVLALAVTEMLGGDEKDILPYALTIEMIHTYSLIHDDLPAMDNDDYRRGIKTNHKVFGEAIAILAGDALLNNAFETMLKHTLARNDKLNERTRLMQIIAESAGTGGMIGGQVVDLESEGKKVSENILNYMHIYKTGALIKAPVLSAAILSGANDEEYNCLNEYAEKIGLAFQIKDDIMDVEGSLKEMGKANGSDAEKGKSTFVTLYGIEKSKKMLDDIINSAVEALNIFGNKAIFLKELAIFIGNRSN